MTDPIIDPELLKRQSAEAAVEQVGDGMTVGLGSGSTAAYAVTALAERVRSGLRMLGIPTSERTAELARSLGVPLASFTEHRPIDLTIDGADEVETGTLNLVKGLGGALLREKIVASAGERLLIVVDDSKLVPRLGSRVPVPVEVVTFGWEITRRRLEALGGAVIRRSAVDGTAFVTDNGNHILDCDFGAIADPPALADAIKRTVGVVESGLFIDLATEIFIGTAEGVRLLTRG